MSFMGNGYIGGGRGGWIMGERRGGNMSYDGGYVLFMPWRRVFASAFVPNLCIDKSVLFI